MKRLISILAALIILSAMPGIAAAAPPDWTLVPVPGPGGDSAPVFFDTNSYLASDIALDVNGNLYVMSGSRIIRFTPEGSTDTSWGKNGVIYDGELEAANSEILNIAADGRGYVYALCRICEDGSPTFIKRYTPDGEADKSWYGDGIMGGKFAGEDFADDEDETAGGVRNGDEIALDSNDNLYVLYDRQVYKFLPDGRPDTKWRKVKIQQPEAVYDDGGDGVWFSNAMRIDRDGNLYLFNGYDRIVSKFGKTGRLLKRYKCPLYYSSEDGFGETKYLINQIAFDSEGNIYNINSGGNSISKYSPKMKPDKAWRGDGIFAAGSDSGPAHTISDFEMDAAGNIYILDGENGYVSKYTNDGLSDTGWGTKGSIGSVNGDGKALLDITNIVCDADGSMYAFSDYLSDGNAIIAKVNSDFTLDDAWGADVYGSFKGCKTDASNSMAIHDGNLYIEPSTGDVGVRYYGLIRADSKGVKDAGWGVTLSEPVWDIQTDRSGHIYVAGPDTISRHLPDGSVDGSWGRSGAVKGADLIGEMAVDNAGRLYISDRIDNCIIRYTPEGHLDIGWGEDGKADIPAAADSGAYYSYFIAIDSAGNLYLSDYLNNRILRYNSSGQLDTAWCGGGEWISESSLSDLAPLIHPTHLMIRGGRLYAIWNDKLYVMSDLIARIGIKTPRAPQAGPEAKETAAPAATLAAWQWAVCIGGLLFCAGAVLAMFLLLPKKKNKRRSMTKIKSIKIAKR